jgi:hypothetical protein
MKTKMSKFLLLLLVAVLGHGCSTAHRSTLSAEEERRIRAITNDRSNWVDPAQLF